MIRRRSTTLEEELNIVDLYTKDLLNFKQIRQKTGIEVRWISESLHKHNIKVVRLTDLQRRVNKTLNDNKELILKMYSDGSCATDIANKFDICHQPVCNFLRENNIFVKQFRRNKHYIDETYFETMNHTKAYWLGYLFADGFLIERYNRVGMNLSIKDECVLHEFKKCLKSEHIIYHAKPPKKIRKIKNQIINSGIISQFRFESKKIADDLRKFGLKGNKSLTLEWPKIEEKYFWSFIRGYFDGDGCLYVSERRRKATFFVISSLSFCSTFIEFIRKTCNVKVFLVKQGKIYRAVINSMKNILILMDKIYADNDAYPRLERKHQKYFNLIKMLEDKPLRNANWKMRIIN